VAATDLTVVMDRSDDRTVLRIVGEIDASNADELDGYFDAASETAPKEIIVDLSALTFTSSSGLSALVRNRHRIDPSINIVIVRPSSHIRRLLQIAAIDDLFDVRE
jgi:anti-sigma B factor antagonist